jgi:arylsulfatase A-like enzyme
MSKQPNILFLLSDEHSYRCFSHLDPNDEGEPVHTPTLDRLTAQATVFHQTYCQVALCTPSRICLLTGLSPMRSGGWTIGSYLKPGNQTLPQAFAAAGYATYLVGKMHLGGNRQFVGFQHRPYGDLTGNHGHQLEPLAEKHVDLQFALYGWIRRAGVTEIPESQLQEQVVARETIAFLREHRHADIAARMRQAIDQQWDFELADEQWGRDQAEAKANVLPVDLQRAQPYLMGNLYLMADHRLVTADTPLYNPVTLTDKPQAVFVDWPGRE